MENYGRSNHRFILTVVLIVILFRTQVINVAKASPVTTTLTLSTGDMSLGPVKVMIEYSIQANLDHPHTAFKGSVTDWKVNLRNGKVTISINVAGQGFSQSTDLPLGKRVEIPVITGLKAFIYTTASARIQVFGKGESDPLSLDFLSEGTRSFKVYVSEDAMEGDNIIVSLPIDLNIRVGLKIDLLIFKADIADTEMGTFSLSPSLEGSLRVTERPIISFLSGSDFIIGMGITLIGGALGISLFLRRRQSFPRKNISQGIVGVIAGVLCMVSLWFPWITYEESKLAGINLGLLLFQLTNISLVQTIIYFIFLLTLLLIVGGYLHLGGYVVGKSLMSVASKWLLSLCVLLLVGLSFVPSIIIEVWSVIMIFGAILGVISIKLERGV